MVYFDVTRLLEWEGRYTGMEVVAYELATALLEKGNRLVYFVPGKGFVDVTKEVAVSEGRMMYANVRRGSIKSILRNRPRQLAGELRRRNNLKSITPVTFQKIDTFFTSDGLWDRQDYIDALALVAATGAKIVHLVHDIVPIVVPHLVHDYMTHAMASYFNQVAPHIDVLISISKNTQSDFMEHFGAKMKSSVEHYLFHHGDDVPNTKPVKPKSLKVGDAFILCVGTIEIRKNHMLLYQTYKLAQERGIDLPKLVVIGREGWLADQTLKLIRDDPAVRDKIIVLGPAPDAEMVWCYKHCLFTVMPSFYEGWGLQVAQSLYFGKVVAASHAGPLPEVGGDLNIYYSPYSPDECLRAITQLLNEKNRSNCEAKIRQSYTTRTWQRSIKEVNELL